MEALVNAIADAVCCGFTLAVKAGVAESAYWAAIERERQICERESLAWAPRRGRKIWLRDRYGNVMGTIR